MAVAAASALAACNAFDEPGSDGSSKRIVPTDTRPVQQALTTPPPITGGTLAVAADGSMVVAADSDRDRISIVELSTHAVREVELEPGEQPGRVALDGAGRAHVVLRGTSRLLSLRLSDGEVLGRSSPCAAPRGVSYDASQDALHVTCAEGRLVSLAAETREVLREVTVPEDARDVLVRPQGLAVSRYKSAELVALDASGQTVSRVRPSNTVTSILERPGGPQAPPSSVTRQMQPHLAWRTALAASSQEVVMLHQSSMEGEIDIDRGPEAEADGSPYGGGGGFSSGCEGVVQTSITTIDKSMTARTVNLGGSVLSVDLAVAPNGAQLAIAQAGARDLEAPEPFTLRDMTGGAPFGVARGGPASAGASLVEGAPVLIADMAQVRGSSGQDFACVVPEGLAVEGQATAVAYTPGGQLVVQTREPARLFVLQEPPFGDQVMIDLGGESVADTGHDLFHRDSGGGIACASCHGEGGDDGHVWAFSGIGQRRTQAVHVGLAGTEPFHWDGDMRDLSHLMGEVFVGRMGGVHQSGERMEALADWMFALQPPVAMVEAADEAAQRGKHLFESSDVGCASCHGGDALTNSESVYVGTTRGRAPLQVPSLRGIAYRAPFIHNGCATTLRDRFTDPACGGGELHGNTSQLSDAEIDDLVAYLKTL